METTINMMPEMPQHITTEELKSLMDGHSSHIDKTTEIIYIKYVQNLLEVPPFSYKQRLSERIAKKMVLEGHMIFANATPETDEGHETDTLNDKAEEYKNLCKEKIMVVSSAQGSMEHTFLQTLIKVHSGLMEEGTTSVESDNISDMNPEISNFFYKTCRYAKRAVIVFLGNQIKISGLEAVTDMIRMSLENTSNIFPLEVELIFVDDTNSLSFVFVSRDFKHIDNIKIITEKQN